MVKISVVINTRNEEKNLPRALASIKEIAEEIIVVDAMSTDQTAVIAKENGAKVYLYKKPVTYVEPVRNFAIEKATGEWIFILDADEEISTTLSKKLKEIAKKREADYYRVPRKNIVFGKWLKHSRWWPDYNIRFFKKGSVTWNEAIHSVPLTVGIGADLSDKEEFAIIHHHYQTIEQYIERMNRYSSEHAKNLITDGYKFKWQDLIKKPTDEFLSRFFFGEGYKDGIHGLALSLLQAFSELTKYLKVWQTDKFKTENPSLAEINQAINKSKKDLNYWQADSLVKSGAGLIQRIKRKYKLL